MSNKKIENKKSGHFGGPMGNIGKVEKAKDFKGTMNKLIEYLKPYNIWMIIVIIFAIGSAAFSIVGPKILGKATTKIFEGLVSKIMGVEGAFIDFSYIKNILLWLLGLYLVSAVFSIIQGYIISGVAQKVSYHLRKEISEKINRMPLKYFDQRTHGEVLSRVTNDVDTVSQTLNQSMSQMITSIVTIIGVLIMMLSISWKMTMVALLILPVSMILIIFVIKKSQKYFKSQQEFLGHVNGHVEEMYGGHNIVKAFNGEEEAIDQFETMNHTLYHSAWKSQFLSGMMIPIMTFIGNIGYVAVSILGGWLAIQKTIEVGDILSFVQYMRTFTQPIGQVAQISNVLQSTAAAAERVFEFLEEPEEALDPESPVKLKEVKGEVDFSHVHFGYDEDKTIINDFSTHIRKGQKVAIVGPTGAGKTTIVKLLMNFYPIQRGDICIDGYPINDFKKSDLRSIFGMVLQDTWLFKGSIMENIRYGRLNATDEEVMEAARLAHVESFVKMLPNGYNMEINEEANNLSGGQKQLITIARAILADPKILILDEATSSVDTRTEIFIQRAMENLMKDRTSFIIAHRLSTIRDADLILVMKDGDIIEQGHHEELLKDNGFYASLYNSQFEK
ncbi:ABC transporter ATP-binding protein [Inediibacterium massiliense]|uniref:ABC transporter ATP-binding protein n=1 Tax=Inediibacterium massiliense TaxID=1658111 RepID=UPI0006B51ED9|nr:ABC transporter ATP-binding protein [Inediibacterium massiliense]